MSTFVIRLKAPRPAFALDMSDEKREIMARHAEYWRPWADWRQMVIFGPCSTLFAAMTHLDQAVTDTGEIALPCGGWHGPHSDTQTRAVRKRRYPIVGGGGITSYIHLLDDAAAATSLALEHDGPGIYNITDDEPAPMRDCLPTLAAALGAKPPRPYPL